jgi:hypothetical protein
MALMGQGSKHDVRRIESAVRRPYRVRPIGFDAAALIPGQFFGQELDEPHLSTRESDLASGINSASTLMTHHAFNSTKESDAVQ